MLLWRVSESSLYLYFKCRAIGRGNLPTACSLLNACNIQGWPRPSQETGTLAGSLVRLAGTQGLGLSLAVSQVHYLEVGTRPQLQQLRKVHLNCNHCLYIILSQNLFASFKVFIWQLYIQDLIWFDSWLYFKFQLFASVYPGKQQMVDQVFGSLSPTREYLDGVLGS